MRNRNDAPEAVISYHSHPYATCPTCHEEQEVDSAPDGPVIAECSFCQAAFSYNEDR